MGYIKWKIVFLCVELAWTWTFVIKRLNLDLVKSRRCGSYQAELFRCDTDMNLLRLVRGKREKFS